MYSKVKYLLVFVLVVGFCQGYAQQSETTEPAQNKIERNLQNIHEKGGDLQNKVFTRIDSLSNKSKNLLHSTTDSLNNLSEAIEGKVQSKIDSLQQKLNKIQSMGNQQLTNTTEKADKLTSRIDSLQNLLSNNMAKLNKYTDGIPEIDGIEKLQIPRLGQANLSKSLPGLEKLSLPEMKGLESVRTQILNQVQDDGLGRIGLPDYQIPSEVKEYTELLKDPSNIDQAIDSKAAQMSEFQTLNNETKELAAMKELPESMLADLKRYQDAEAMKVEAKDVAIKKATDYFAGQQDKLSQAQGMMSKLKKKYSYVAGFQRPQHGRQGHFPEE